MNIPNDPIMLLSYINTQLRNFYPSLDALCKDLNLEQKNLTDKLASIDCHYNKEQNQFR